MKHGILAVDFSEGWELARRHLAPLVPYLGLERLTLVNVIPPQLREARKQELRGLRTRQLQELATGLAAEYKLPVEGRLAEGFIAATLLDVAAEAGANLVICANQSHSRARALFLGNVALNLARMSRLPLLILPVDSDTDAEGPLLLATDGSDAAAGAERMFSALAGDHPAQVLWVDADTGESDQPDAEPRLAELAERGGAIRALTLQGDPDELITETASKAGAALLIIGKRGWTPLPELPLGSTAEAVCRAARTPVLLVPAAWKR